MDGTLLLVMAVCGMLIVVSAWGLLHVVEFEERIGERLRGAHTRTAEPKFDVRSVLDGMAQFVASIGGVAQMAIDFAQLQHFNHMLDVLRSAE